VVNELNYIKAENARNSVKATCDLNGNSYWRKTITGPMFYSEIG